MAGTHGGIFLSTDDGIHWTQVDTNIASALGVSGTQVFPGTENSEVLRSLDNGHTWTYRSGFIHSQNILSFYTFGSKLLAGLYTFSTDSGLTWNSDDGLYAVQDFAAIGNNLFAATINGILISTDSASSWSGCNWFPTINAYSLAVRGDTLLAGADSGVFLSTDLGLSWTRSHTGLTGGQVNALVLQDTTFFAGTSDGFFISTDDSNWAAENTGLDNTLVENLTTIGSHIFASTNGEGVARSTDNGVHWTSIGPDLTDMLVSGLFLHGTELFIGTNHGVFMTSDEGATWNPRTKGLPGGWEKRCFTAMGDNLFVGTASGFFRSTDDGLSWSHDTVGLPKNFSPIVLSSIGNNIFVCQNGIYRSTDSGSTWQNVFPNADVTAFAEMGSSIFADLPAGLYRSNDQGATWVKISAFSNVINFCTVGSILFAATYGVSMSTDSGVTWTPENSGLEDTMAYCLTSVGDQLFVGTNRLGVWNRSIADMTSLDQVIDYSSINKQPQIFPNPFSQSTTINYSSSEVGPTQITIQNLLGQQVAQLFDGELDAGEHSFVWDPSGEPAGMYFCVVHTNGSVQLVPIVLAH